MAKVNEMQSKWASLSKRERWMIFGAGLIGLVSTMDSFMLQPLRQRSNEALDQTVKMQEEVVKINTKIAGLSTSAQGAKSGRQTELDAIKDKLKQQQDAIANISAHMVKPNEVLPLLREMLKKHEQVEVVSLESQPVDVFIKKHALAAKTDTASDATTQASNKALDAMAGSGLDNVYQHTIKLTVRGDYQAVMNYAYELKKHAVLLSWESAEMKSDYPKTELTLYLYTLSLENVWMGI